MPDTPRPDDVPDELLDLYGRNYDGNTPEQAERKALAAVLAVHERQVRERVAAEYQDLLASIWLYVKWRYVTKQLTTEQKEMWADAVEAASDPEAPTVADRWWRA